MKTNKSKFEEFEKVQITKNQQKAIRGGDGDDSDPKKAGGGGGNG
ncbi:rSAM-modified peptide [Flavobacterium procerum]|uniref:RSAM-modified peptide n=1 Tax=Flavobacterium procerum TaxID=1455569 RepID=A0ABV6BT85_9FLAO